MDMQHIEALRPHLPAGRTLYSYYKDRYSLQLLRYAIHRPLPVATLRQHRFARLLHKPQVKSVLASCGKTLTPALLNDADGNPAATTYSLSLGVWGKTRAEQIQMSRRGANLVLQLNFNQAHNRACRKLLGLCNAPDPFNYTGHPALDDARPDRRYTLAWARLDIDLDRGEALIEEVQSDWIGRVAWLSDWVRRYHKIPAWFERRTGMQATPQAVIAYDQTLLAPHRALWDEAMLSAALFFIREQLGIARVWMHTPESGLLLKRIRYGAPPRSIYSTLPRRFCFEPTRELPVFLHRNKSLTRQMRRQPDLALHALTLQE